MLTNSSPATPKAPPPARFVWECDACEAKQATPTPELPEGWTGQNLDNPHGLTFCRECSTSTRRGTVQ